MRAPHTSMNKREKEFYNTERLFSGLSISNGLGEVNGNYKRTHGRADAQCHIITFSAGIISSCSHEQQSEVNKNFRRYIIFLDRLCF